MRRSFPIVAAWLLAVSACSVSQTPPEKPLPVVTVRTATMDVTPGVEVLARLQLPEGFTPAPLYPPMWLQGGKEIAVAGTLNGHVIVLGFAGSGFHDQRVILQDGEPDEDGNIVDLAVSPDTMSMALAVAVPDKHKLEVVVRDLIASGGGGHPVTSFDGRFEDVSIAWIDNFTIALAMRSAGGPSLSEQPGAESISPASPGLYLVGINGMVTASYQAMKCTLSRLSWSPNGIHAVGQGAPGVSPVIVDRQQSSCITVPGIPALRVLDWSRSGNSFLYYQPLPAAASGSFIYQLGSGSRLVAIASNAAAFTETGNVLTLGNGQLTGRALETDPNQRVLAQVASLNPHTGDVDIQSLGFETTPALLGESVMSYTIETDAAAIAALGVPAPGSPLPARKLVVYSTRPREAFLVAFGPAHGPVLTSWSPRGRYLAIVDGDATVGSALTIIRPSL